MKYVVKINPEYEHLRGFIEGLPTATDAELGRLVYSTRNKVYATQVGDITLSVKSFGVPRFLGKFTLGDLKVSKARSSYENALKLINLGIGTPEPVAYVEEYRMGCIHRSFYVCLFLDGYRDVSGWEKRDDAAALLDRFGKFIAMLHSKGVCHNDFTPGNILFNESYDFRLVDLNNVFFDRKNPEDLLANFKSVHPREDQTLRLAHCYAKYSPFKQVSDIELVEIVLDKRRVYLRYRTVLDWIDRMLKNFEW